MKPPQKRDYETRKENVRHENTLQSVVVNRSFTLQNEFTFPSIRAVWTVLDGKKSGEKKKYRRKRR